MIGGFRAGILIPIERLGPELLTNPYFSTNSNWSGSGFISGGELTFTNTPLYGNQYQVGLNLPQGKRYKATIKINSVTKGLVGVFFGTDISLYPDIIIGIASAGIYTGYLTLTYRMSKLYIGASETTAVVDWVSLREVLP